MDGKGPIIVLSCGCVLVVIYFLIYGFSHVQFIRWGQYAGIFLAFYMLCDAFLSN